ncbi:MAG: M20 family metallopeptidase [Pseudomonadota bacterium]
MTIPTAQEIAATLVRINSINPPGNEAACAAYLMELLGGAGFELECHEHEPGRPSLVACLKSSGERKPLCFGGHTDVVPLGNAPWTVEPFGAEIRDGRMWGRGSCDMKAGVAAFVEVALKLAQEPGRAADIILAIVAGEETGCDGSKYVQSLGVLPECGAIVIAEPTSNYPILGHRGALWLNVETKGITAHGSMPQHGDNAVYKAARAVGKLEDYGFNVAPHPLLGSTTLNVGTFQGGININSVPDRASFTIDIRSIPGHDNQSIIQDLANYLGDECSIETVVDVDPVITAEDDPWVQEVFAIAETHMGERPEPRGAPYFTDASALTPACGHPPTVILGPGDMKMAHQTDEYCEIARIDQAVGIYDEIARRWCGLEAGGG